MGRLGIVATVVLLLTAAIAARAEAQPVVDDVGGVGWTAYRFAPTEGPVALTLAAYGSGPLAFGLRVLDGDGRPLVAWDAQSVDSATYVAYTVDGESGEVVLLGSNVFTGLSYTGATASECRQGPSNVSHNSVARILRMELGCVDGSPFTVLAYGGGSGLESRRLVVSGATHVLAHAEGERVLTVAYEEIARDTSVGWGGNWLTMLTGSARYTLGGRHAFEIENEMWGAIGTSSSGDAIQLRNADGARACSCRLDGGAPTSGAWTLAIDGQEHNAPPYVIAVADARIP